CYSTNAIKCYVCGGDNACADPYTKDPAKLVDVGAGFDRCLKSKVDGVVTRGATESVACKLLIDGDNKCKTKTEGGKKGTACCCKGDGCNGTSSLKYGILMVLPAWVMPKTLAEYGRRRETAR
ncbi:unnamed protein product, partial [Didymodactylos carnosus]